MTREQREAVERLRQMFVCQYSDYNFDGNTYDSDRKILLDLLTPPDENHRAVVVMVPSGWSEQCDPRCHLYMACQWSKPGERHSTNKGPGCPWYEEEQ